MKKMRSISSGRFSTLVPILKRLLLQHQQSSLQNVRSYSRSASVMKARVFAYDRNRHAKRDPIGIKKMESHKSPVKVFEGITFCELAVAMDRDIDKLFDCIVEISSEKVAEKYLEHLDEPMDRKLMLEIVSYLKMRPIFVPPPSKKAKQTDPSVELFPQPPPEQSERKKRAPVVTIMGHVDHGKTTLLDALRHSNIVAQEFGGITQHIGAFSVKLPDVGDQPVTFLDTPGHSAFKAMRARGARATDIVVLVVAADDSVMEQTVESIRYAREAGVPIIVAINKCDKPGADPERVLLDLMKHDIVPEKFGGDTLVVEISALQRKGIDKIQEAILLQADLMHLESTPKGPVEGTIIESSNLQGIGNVCTLIVNRGTLKRGTLLVAGTSWGRVRAMTNEFNEQVQEAGPSCPVRVAGWRHDLPAPGELALEAPNDSKAQAVAEHRRRKKQEQASSKDMEVIEKRREEARRRHHERRMRLFQQGLFAKRDTEVPVQSDEEKAAAQVPRLPIVLRCDVDGTNEAIQAVLATYTAHDQVRLEIVHSGVGPLNETDLELAAETSAHILTFNAPVSRRVHALAEQKNVQLEEFHVIYKLIERIKQLLNQQIKPILERRLMGGGVIIHKYNVPDGLKKKQPIAGIRVDWGLMEKKGIWRFLRVDRKHTDLIGPEKEDSQAKEEKPEVTDDGLPVNKIIYEGPILSMQHDKQTINKATTDMQIGVAVHDKDIHYKLEDKVEVYEDVPVSQKVDGIHPDFEHFFS